MPINLNGAIAGLGTGYANQANTAYEQQQRALALQKQQAQQALLFQAMQQGQQPGQMPPQGAPQQPAPQQPPTGTPPQPMPQAGGMPSPLAKPGGDAAVLAALGSPQQSGQDYLTQLQNAQQGGGTQPSQPPVAGLNSGAQPTGTPPQQPAQPQLPDFNTFMTKLSQMPGSPAEKGAAMMQMLPVYTQQWTRQNENNYKNQQIALDRIRTDLEGKRVGIEQQNEGINQQKADEQERRDKAKEQQDAARQKERDRHDEANEYINTQKNLTAAQKNAIQEKELNRHHEAMEQIDSGKLENQTRATNSKIVQGEEGLKIKQQNADTASDRAGTYKYQAMQGTALKKEQIEANIKLGQDKLKEMKAKVSPKDNSKFKLAQDKYNKLASLYQSQSNPQAVNQPSPQVLETLKGQMDSAYADAEKLAGGEVASTTLVKPSVGEEVRTDGQGNYFVLRDGKPTPAEPPAGQ